jgi:phage virion morphogenesis protein
VTGVTATFSFDDSAVRVAIDGLRKMAAEPAALLGAMGVGLVRSVQNRFDAGTDPDGNDWAPLRPDYAADKKGPGILRELGMRGGLQGSITAAVDGTELKVGSNKIYAAVHQFGATIVPVHAKSLVFTIGGRVIRVQSVTIPARPYLGLSHDDETRLVAVAEDFMRYALVGATPPPRSL